MEKLEYYRSTVRQIVERHAQYIPSHGQIEPLAICDVASDNYLLMDIGWDKTGRVHAVVIHLRIRSSKIWVEWDGTEEGVTQELLDAGVAKEDIVLGFYRPDRRQLTDFAIA